MAKITITIEDIENGMVTIKSEPSMKEMGDLFMNKGLTAAHSFAIAGMNALRKEAMVDEPVPKSEDSELIV